MESINIKGKEYIQVNERIKYFRENYKDGQILTEMLKNENGICVFVANILVGGQMVATGHAYEKEGSSYINKTSYIENCETSAIGRALGIFGIGIDTSIASAEEVNNAINNQKPHQSINDIIKRIEQLNDIDKFNQAKSWFEKQSEIYSDEENKKVFDALLKKENELQ